MKLFCSYRAIKVKNCHITCIITVLKCEKNQIISSIFEFFSAINDLSENQLLATCRTNLSRIHEKLSYRAHK